MIIVCSTTLTGMPRSLARRWRRGKLIGRRLEFSEKVETWTGLVIHSVPARFKAVAGRRRVVDFEVS